jgi:hypothetical protein
MNRRTILVVLAALATPTFKCAAQEVVEFRWTVPPALLTETIGDLQYCGKVDTESDSKGLPLVAIIAGVAALPILADAILRLRARLIQPGITIDARSKPVRIEVNGNIPKGYILLIDSKGANLIDSSELKTSGDLSKLLSASIGK